MGIGSHLSFLAQSLPPVLSPHSRTCERGGCVRVSSECGQQLTSRSDIHHKLLVGPSMDNKFHIHDTHSSKIKHRHVDTSIDL